MAKDKVVIRPSEIHEFVYCPRLFFFDYFLGRKRGLKERLRLLLGRLYHAFLSIPDRLKGRLVEETLEVDLGKVLIRGRPDAYSLEDGRALVVERKSSRPPRRGVWSSDSAQALTYAFMLARLHGVDVEARVEYPTKTAGTRLDEEKINWIIRIIDDIVLVKAYGIVPKALKSPRKCNKCPFREICKALDDGLDVDVYEPGEWLAGRIVDESFK